MEKDLRVFWRFCALLGIHTSGNGNTKQLATLHSYWQPQTHTLQLVYSCTLMLLLCGLGVFTVACQEQQEGYRLSWSVATIVYISQVLANLLILAEVLCKRDSQERFLHTLSAAAEMLQLHLRQPVNRRALLRRINWSLYRLGALSVLCVMVYGAMELRLQLIGFFWQGLLPIVSMRVRILQLLVYVQLLQAHLRQLNRQLRQLVAHKMAPQARLLDVCYARLERVQLLLAVRQTYALLFTASRQLNDFGGYSLFAIVACYFLDFTCHAYFMLLALERTRPWSVFITGASTLLPIAVVICKLCWFCHQCKKEGQLSNNLLNKLIAAGSTNKVRRYNNYVYDFSMQLQHEVIYITARNIFSFDLRLIMHFFVATVTHLIILIQFRNSEEMISPTANSSIHNIPSTS